MCIWMLLFFVSDRLLLSGSLCACVWRSMGRWIVRVYGHADTRLALNYFVSLPPTAGGRFSGIGLGVVYTDGGLIAHDGQFWVGRVVEGVHFRRRY